VIDAGNAVVLNGDEIIFDVIAAGTGTRGLNVNLTFSPT
jgi:hypothetical protein